MGRSSRSLSSPSLSMIRPLPAPRSLTGELVARLTEDITSGKIVPGSQLPTEQELIAATGVSRTVVREAVAALRAEGLVITRQGVGAFVPENARRPLRIDFDRLSPLRAVLDVMELRTGIEIEAAGLAAARAAAPLPRRYRCRSQARRGRDRARFCAPLQHRRRDRKPAVQPVFGTSRSLRHPAADHSRRAGNAETCLWRDVPTRAPCNRSSHPQWERSAGPRSDASTPGQ